MYMVINFRRRENSDKKAEQFCSFEFDFELVLDELSESENYIAVMRY